MSNDTRDALEHANLPSTYANTVRLEAQGAAVKLVFGEAYPDGVTQARVAIVIPIDKFNQLVSHANQLMVMMRTQNEVQRNAKPVIQG